MDDLFLIANSNGNGESFMLVTSDGQNCTKQFVTKTIAAMAQHLGEEHLADIQENLINTEELPCDSCHKKKCTLNNHYCVIDSKIAQEIFNLVSEEHGEEFADYLEQED